MAESTSPTTPEDGDGLVINGTLYTTDDLTFREQKRVRATVLELAGSEDDATIADVTAAFAFVVLNRDGEVSLDEILDMKPSDLSGNGAAPRPTKSRASATSGRRK